MSSFSVIMLPGAWGSEEESFKLGQLVGRISNEQPLDVVDRVRTTGFAVRKLPESQAQECVAAIFEAGHQAATIADAITPWIYPEVHSASRVSFEGQELDYEAGSQEGTLRKQDLLFLHLSWFSKATTASEAPESAAAAPAPGQPKTGRFARDALLSRDSSRGETLSIDLHHENPRAILRIDVKTTKYAFPRDGSIQFVYARPRQVLSAIEILAVGVPIMPDRRLPSVSFSDRLWESAQTADQADQRSRGSWYRQLAEHGLLMETTLPVVKAASTGAGAKDVRAELEHARAAAVNAQFTEQLETAEKWLKRGMVRRALKEAEKAISMEPERPEGYRLRARVHIADNAHPQAKADLAKAASLKPKPS